MRNKFVYLFSEGNAQMRALLGGKGANLCEMTRLGMPVPKGFVVTTEACADYYDSGEKLSPKIIEQIFKSLAKVEKDSGKKFGDENNPLIVSIRSGARVSMPGMMDSILNLGLNDKIVQGFAKKSSPRFAYDCYRRFIQMYSNVVMGIDIEEFENEIDAIKKENKVILDKDLTLTHLKQLIKKYKGIYKNKIGEDFPQDVKKLLIASITAVFRSWNNSRAKLYRKINSIPDSWGTAVNVQEMVFGNLNKNSGTGVAFTRNPSTGENVMYGEYLMNAQGEDVVAGIRTPFPIQKLQQQNPKIYSEFVYNAKLLEKYYGDMQDMEFTIENGKLYMLQTRNGKRTVKAGIKIAIDLIKEELITEKEALGTLEPNKIDFALHPILNEEFLSGKKPLAQGLPASPGGACGKIVFSPEKAVTLKNKNEKSILVRLETSPEDIEGMTSAEGILTARGGMTSHAAVVARGLGTVCVSGCESIIFEKNSVKIGGVTLKEGDVISIDGNSGKVYAGEVPTIAPDLSGDFREIMQIAKKYQKIAVHANADTIEEAQRAFEFGAEGIGLCRTEHMFFENDRILAVREMILASTSKEREKALKKLLPFQRNDFEGIFKAMQGRPVTIRLLDPPLHEFLPKTEEDISELSKVTRKSPNAIKDKITKLHEFNPMLGHRGLRLAITYPEIYAMQTRAIIEGALDANKKYGIEVRPEIMIPLTSSYNEFVFVKEIVDKTIMQVLSERNEKIDYLLGTMIETPRACLLAGNLAELCDFFSFGTNDLTQLTYAFSRDDAGKFLEDYYSKDIFRNDPFKTLDRAGVGELIQIAVKRARMINPKIKLGVCGEHGGDEKSIKFFTDIGLDYVSCSPYRVPVAKLSSAKLD